MAPKGDSIKADVKKMRADAKKWQGSAQDISIAAEVAAQLKLEQSDFSFAGGEVYTAYVDLQSWAAGLLKSAAKNLGNMAGGLSSTATEFEDQDNASAAHINKSYDGHSSRGGN